jgi:mono/diheme cytochrome c family protein
MPSVLEEFILDAESFHSHSRMPAFRELLSSQDADDIVAYLRRMAAHKGCNQRDACALVQASSKQAKTQTCVWKRCVGTAADKEPTRV